MEEDGSISTVSRYQNVDMIFTFLQSFMNKILRNREKVPALLPLPIEVKGVVNKSNP